MFISMFHFCLPWYVFGDVRIVGNVSGGLCERLISVTVVQCLMILFIKFKRLQNSKHLNWSGIQHLLAFQELLFFVLLLFPITFVFHTFVVYFMLSYFKDEMKS